MKHIKNAKVTAKIQIREGAQIRVLGGTGTGTRMAVEDKKLLINFVYCCSFSS